MNWLRRIRKRKGFDIGFELCLLCLGEELLVKYMESKDVPFKEEK